MSDAKSKDGADLPLLDPSGPSNASPNAFPNSVPSEGYLDIPAHDELTLVQDEAPPQYSDLPAEQGPPPNPLAPQRPAPPRPAKYFRTRGPRAGTERYMDPRLDSDPAYLAEWMTYQAQFPPRVSVRVEGTHRETKHGSRDKSETRDVVDFDLQIDLTAFLYSDVAKSESWSDVRTVAYHEVVRRGTSLRRAASVGEIEGGAKPSLIEWAHRYCASHAGLKTFSLKREVTGFDNQYVRERVAALARETGYRGSVRVSFPVQDARVSVYSSGRVNELRLTRWVRWLFYLTLLFLVVWPYLFLRTKRFEVLVAEWPFSRRRLDGGTSYVSVSEATWVNIWAGAIRRGVLGRRRGWLDQRDIGEEERGRVGEGSVARAVGAMEVVQRQYGWGHDS